MRILLDQGIYDMRNLGQNALIQVAIERVKKLWPNASIGVVTLAPQLLNLFHPDVLPISPDGSRGWDAGSSRQTGIWRIILAFVLLILLKIRERIWYKWPGFHLGAIISNIKKRLPFTQKRKIATTTSIDKSIYPKQDYRSLLAGVALFVATGSQYMCDHARGTALEVLDRLEASIQQGIPTAMVGQGIGPIEDEELLVRAKEVLPRIDLILVRERLEAPALLSTLGVDPKRVIVTGDDAIELAYNARTSLLGQGIGVSVRCMPSTKMTADDTPTMSVVIREAAKKHDATLIGLPISLSLHERDDLCTQRIMNGYNKISMNRKMFQTPMEYVKNLQRCRLVVTGTFHSAVLALAQGIPVICVVRSSLYANKFMGLADMFGKGCAIIYLEDEHFRENLAISIDCTWQSAEELRKDLLEKARQQVEWGKAAYQRLNELVILKENVI